MTRVLPLVMLLTAALLSNGCATRSGESLVIDTREVVGVRFMPDELTDMLRELGYDWIPIVDPAIRQEVKSFRQDGEHHMRFEYLQTRQVRIDARIRSRDGFTRLHFYEPDSQTLNPSSMALFQQLQDRAALQFGAANISR
jgi:hypothetical protein